VGNFGVTCYDAGLESEGNSGVFLSAYCAPINGYYQGTAIDLNEDIKNDNGNLVYIGP
jgi:hypothetical protein